MAVDHYTREELKTIKRSELCDEILFEIASREFGVSTYLIFTTGMHVKRGTTFTNHVDAEFEQFWIHGRAPNDIREYAIECLTGQAPMILDEGFKNAALLA